MKKFLLSTIVIVFGLVILDILTGILGKELRNKLPDAANGPVVKINYITTRLKSDIVVFGSSTATHHYVPGVIKSSLDSVYGVNNTFYNAGVDGHTLQYQCCWIELLLDRCSPKILILDTRDGFLFSKTKLNDLAPYYDDYDIVKEYFKDLDYKENIKVLSNLYKYNETLIKYLYGMSSKHEMDDGYQPLYRTMSDETANSILEEQHNSKISNKQPILDNILVRVIEKCKEKNVLFVIACSPIFGDTTKNPCLTEICSKYNVPFIDFSSSEYFNMHHELFQDSGHLNNTGAEEYSQMLINQLLPYLN